MTRIVGKAEVQSLLPMRACIDAMRGAFAAMAAGRTVTPLRWIVDLPEHSAMLGMMPGWLGEPKCFGVKVISVYPRNFGTAFGSHQGAILLFEPEHGSLIGVVDGGTVTRIRTAAASAVATDLLARPDSVRLAVLGYGEQAWSHVEAMMLVRTIKHARIWGRDFAKATTVAREMSARFGLEVEPAREAARCVADADIVCTVTAAADPILFGRDMAAGVHVNVVGSSRAKDAEIDSDLLLKARVFADNKQGMLEQGGEYVRAAQRGLVDERHILGNIADVLSGALPGRLRADDITLYKSLGLVIEDLAAAAHIIARAEAEGRGALIDL